ncbi:MAG: class I mannose-6-phosphate isomerase [Tepidisphaeraceae bacterium]
MTKLAARIVDKPWGRCGIDPRFGADANLKIGEIWFEPAAGTPPLGVMAKYLFTTERLSIQVHPDEATARARGLPHGKDECWLILDAEPGAEIGIGTRRPTTADQLLESALDGTIERYIDWRPARRGQFIYNPAGTVHALGPGLTVLEVQQPYDVTYRLFDYGRPRALHLEDGRAAVAARPHFHPSDQMVDQTASSVLIDGPYFGVAWCAFKPPALPPGYQLQLMPIDRAMMVGDLSALPGECHLVDCQAASLRSDGAFVLTWLPAIS